MSAGELWSYLITSLNNDRTLKSMSLKRSYQSRFLLRLVGLWFTGALIIASSLPRWASAQSTDDPWAVPLNLSHSGAATNPSIVIDSKAVMHAVWQDEFANFVYTRFDNGQWSAPEQTYLHQLFGLPASQEETERSEEPFYTGPNPLFIAGPGQYIFAIWITPQGSLYASRVFNRSFDNVAAWHEAQLLSASAASFAAAIDASGALHVAYTRILDGNSNPAGIYHTRSIRNGLDWSAPVLLYESPYFRTLGSGDANLNLTTAGTADAPIVFTVWDNRPRKQVLLAKSSDGGVSWEPPMQVAGPSPDSGLDGPFNIRLGAKENNLVLVWQSGQPGGSCTQFFQSSGDAGATWSEAQVMIEDLPGCAQANDFVAIQAASPGSLLFLLTKIQSQIFLSAWNGSQWSEPQAQPILSGFEDPEIYSQVAYDCHQVVLVGEHLYIVGCDRGGGNDIWVTSRNVESTTFMFSPPVWSQPAPVTSDRLEVGAVDLVATEDDLIHAFFSQRQNSSIYYTRWDGTTWSRITPVLQVPNGNADQQAIAVGPGDELFLIARSSTGSLYFSRANSKEAVTPSSWSTPIRLQIAHDGKVSPADVAWDGAGTVYIAYSVPVNDERGVYLIRSKDQGKTWSEPLQVFDGAATGFEVVGSPSLQVSVNGSINLMWNQLSIQADGVSQPLSLYFVSSEDAGYSFNKAELVVEAPVVWREIVTDSKGNLHRLWRRLDMMGTLWDQVSYDGGRSWQTPQGFPAEGGTTAITVDTIDRLHLVDVGQGSLNHWLWDESRWQAEAPARWSLASQYDGPAELSAAAVNRDGKMVIVLVAPTDPGDVAERPLLYATRMLDLSPREMVIQESPTQSPPSPTAAPATPPPERLFTPATIDNSGSARPQSPIDPINTSEPMSPVTRVLLPAALLLISVLSVVALRAVRGRAR